MNFFLFGIYPYIAVAVCVLGCWYRYTFRQESWKADSDLLLCRCKIKRIGLKLLHWGIFLLLAGHAVGLLTPHEVYEPFISPAHKQILAMVAGGIFGAMVFAGLSLLLYRRIFYLKIRRTSSLMDYAVLVSLLLTVITGLLTIYASAGHPDGSIMLKLSNWAQYIVTFRPGASDFVAGVPLIYKVHIFFGLTTLFALFPFGRLVHAISGIAAFASYPFRATQVVRILQMKAR